MVDKLSLTTVFEMPEVWRKKNPHDRVEVTMVYEDVAKIYEYAIEERKRRMEVGVNK